MAVGQVLLRGLRGLISALVPADVESARLEWEHAYRDLAELARDPAVEERSHSQLRAVTTELRRRVGGMFTLRELVDSYGSADSWVRQALSEQGTPDWPRMLAVVEGAAFHLYARGAVDYRP